MYSYDVIYLQHRRFVEVVFYLKEKKCFIQKQSMQKCESTTLSYKNQIFLSNQLFLTEILMSSAISKNLLLLLLSRSLLKTESMISWKSASNISSPENQPKNTGKW